LLSARVLRKAAHRLEQTASAQTVAIRQAMARHDMVANADEAYYAEQYWRFLLPELERRFPDRKARVLDLGCGQGRLSLPVAKWVSGSVIGVDITPEAIEAARGYAGARGLRNLTFITEDAVDYLCRTERGSFDLIIATEITFFMPRYRQMLSAVAHALAPGGFLFISFRSQYYYLLSSIGSRDWVSARLVRDQREGNWSGSSTWFSWHTVDDARKLLHEAGLGVEWVAGIGIASGIEGDPLAVLAQPSSLTQRDRAELMELEISLAPSYPEVGRYLIAVATKSRRETSDTQPGRSSKAR
jgi:2-polyprenyl-3-methyl-5-hydroxy-6-metoxy-1,4-benzoquinol methylase